MKKILRPFLLLLLAIAATSPRLKAAAEPAAPYLVETFEPAVALPKDWKAEGDVTVVEGEAFAGARSLRIARKQENFDATTSITTQPVEVRGGPAEFTGAFKAALHSPDNSFNAGVLLECLDGDGKVLEALRVADFSGNSNWRSLKKGLELPAGTQRARVRIELNKATGQFWADAISLSPAPGQAAAPSNPIQRIVMKTSVTGNMFYPGEKPLFEVTIESGSPLAKARHSLLLTVCDYWGAEQFAPQRIKLVDAGAVGDRFEYKAQLDLSAEQFETGKYYEARVAVDAGVGEPAREFSSFVFLPEAATKAYPWNEIPFSSRNWDNRVPEYFKLSDRIGIRLVGVWGGWSAEPPYTPEAPGFEFGKSLNIAILSRTPVVSIEHHRRGHEKYTDTVLREGAKRFFEKFGTDGTPLVVTLGNEPQPSGPTVAKNVKAYKVMYEEIKKISPETFIVGTSVGPQEEYFKQGFHKYSDAVDFHTYEDSEGLAKTFKKYEELFAKYGNKQPIWATELGLNSQGLPRRIVAGELIKKFSWFFSFGGQNASWFGICYPDRKGKLRGASDDSHNVFNGIYGNYSPRLDALAYYNAVNAISIKKFIAHTKYEGDIHSFLFLDRDGQNLQVLWKERGAKEVAVPLESVERVKVLRIDGTSTLLDAKGKQVVLRVSEDPLLLLYKGSQKTLPAKLAPSPVTVTAVPEKVTRGAEATLALALPRSDAGKVRVELPPSWKFSKKPAADSLEITISAPDETEARFVPVHLGLPDGDISLVIPVQGQLSAEIVPVVDKAGAPAVELRVRNDSAKPETLQWKLSLTQQIPLEAGKYSLEVSRPADAYFSGAAEGQLQLEARGEASVPVGLAGVNPLTPYRIRAVVTDALGRALTHERFIGGFVAVPKAKTAPALDGKLDEADWARSRPQALDRSDQFRKLLSDIKWGGPADLSAKIQFLWDEKALYVGVSVQDDVFRNTAEGSNIWAGDGLQFLIDPARSSKDKPGKYDYAVAQTKNGPVAWCYLSGDGSAPAGEVKGIELATRPATDSTGGMTYELAIPWNRLAPFKPRAGANLGMAVILNEDDAPKRDSFMTWFGDIQSKEVDAVGDLLLTE